MDATEHRTDTLSNFIYVDIVDRKGKTVLAKKIKRDSCGFANNFEIPHVFPAGDYTLRAYTGWMTNFDPAFFFQRNIRIGNSLSGRVNAAVTYTDPKNGTPQAIVRFTGPDSEPYPDVNVRFEVFDRQWQTNIRSAAENHRNRSRIRRPAARFHTARRVRKHRDRPGRALLQKRVLLSRGLRARGRKVYA